MLAKTAAGAVGLLILAALILVGVACAALAIDFALSPAVGAAWAAAITAILLLMVPVIILIMLAVRGSASARREEAALRMLSALAKDSPMIAILGVGLVGALEFFTRKRKR